MLPNSFNVSALIQGQSFKERWCHSLKKRYYPKMIRFNFKTRCLKNGFGAYHNTHLMPSLCFFDGRLQRYRKSV